MKRGKKKSSVNIDGGNVQATSIAGQDVYNINHIYGPQLPETLPRLCSNIQAKRKPLIGREALSQRIIHELGSTPEKHCLVLHGPPGVGKSELAREIARQQFSYYPGGTYEINFASGVPYADLAGIGRNNLDQRFSPDLTVPDQAAQTLCMLNAMRTLLIYDNVIDADAVALWLPRAGSPSNVIITTILENWEPGWWSLEVKPLTLDNSIQLIEKLAGAEIARRRGRQEAELAGGFPV